MLAPYLETAKQALRGRNVVESMKTVARIARKMQSLFTGTEPERFWFTLVGLCEGLAGGLIVPDECIAQIFKTGAFMIKHAREKGGEVDRSVDYQTCQQQMLYYIAACKAQPFHIANIRSVFAIDEHTIETAGRGLVHLDALVTALSSALDRLDTAVAFINSNDLAALAAASDREAGVPLQEALEAAGYRLDAAGQLVHADSVRLLSAKLQELFRGSYSGTAERLEHAIQAVVRGIIDIKIDLEHKLEHGFGSNFSSREFELRASVVSATFNHMGLVENTLHDLLRRKALGNALFKKPACAASTRRLTTALHRHLNKSDQDHAQLRAAVHDADNGEPDLDLLYTLAQEFFGRLPATQERKVLAQAQQLLEDIAGALAFAGLERESRVIEQCHRWLCAAGKAGSVREDEAFNCFADAFAQVELHLQRSLIDPLDDTSHLLAIAEQRAGELGGFIDRLSSGCDVLAAAPERNACVQDADIPAEFREVFVEEAEEIVAELAELFQAWASNPRVNETLRDIRRHFHTFKGNGRAVGANILGELGWAAQDMLDRVIDGDLDADDRVKRLVGDVVSALPALVMSYRRSEGFDVAATRELTNKCFRLANAGAAGPVGAPPPADGAAGLRAALPALTGQISH
jgi:HPt (histidine-containing phosphotransfer) domain-containing protein